MKSTFLELGRGSGVNSMHFPLSLSQYAQTLTQGDLITCSSGDSLSSLRFFCWFADLPTRSNPVRSFGDVSVVNHMRAATSLKCLTLSTKHSWSKGSRTLRPLK